MIRGDIYLHPSLTEAFGTVIVEAASCGLYVVATAVGGVPEVLPPHMTIFAKPEEDGPPPRGNINLRCRSNSSDDPSNFDVTQKSGEPKTLPPRNKKHVFLARHSLPNRKSISGNPSTNSLTSYR
jgi:hypothetical protein